jgi:hypothetical protein
MIEESRLHELFECSDLGRISEVFTKFSRRHSFRRTRFLSTS